MDRATKFMLLAAACIAVLLYVVLSRPEPTGTINTSAATYEKALARWQEHNLSTYTMTLEIKGSLTGSGSIPLPNDTVYTTTIYVHDGRAFSPNPYIGDCSDRANRDPRSYCSVEALFAVVESSVHNPSLACKIEPDTIFFDYDFYFDRELGYPTFMSITGRSERGAITMSRACGGYQSWVRVVDFQH